MLRVLIGTILLFNILNVSVAETVKVKMYTTVAKGQGQYVGLITAKDTPYGLLLTPNLKINTQGIHGFHVHQHPDCNNSGLAAGGHLDPEHTGKHLGPYQKGHLGDMPPIVVDNHGLASLPVLAPRLKVKDIKNHSLMIHVHGDNYSDRPEKLGGGGPRMICGVVAK